MEPRESPGVEPEDDARGPTGPVAAVRPAGRVAGRPAARPAAAGRGGRGAARWSSAWSGSAVAAGPVGGRRGSSRSPSTSSRSPRSTLDPPPPPWIRRAPPASSTGSGPRPGATSDLSVLDLDLDALRNDFRRCPWVEEVPRVERSYRTGWSSAWPTAKPVAVAEFDATGSRGRHRRGRGDPARRRHRLGRDRARRSGSGGSPTPDPISEVEPPASTRAGLPWKQADGSLGDRDRAGPRRGPAGRVPPATAGRSTPGGKPAPDFVAIQPDEETAALLRPGSARATGLLGRGPGRRAARRADRPRPSGGCSWTGSTATGRSTAKSPDYLEFTTDGVELVRGPIPAGGDRQALRATVGKVGRSAVPLG